MSRTPPLASLLLLLALRGCAVRGDCGQPPEVPNAKAELNESTFPDQSTVTYTCNEGFIKIPGKTDTVTCLADGQWSEIEDVCGRSCNVPTRLSFAALKRAYIRMNFYPVGISVEYECRPGFQRNPFLSTKSTCLPNLEWSKVDIFCSKKQCPNPGDIENGNINITSDILFGAQIFFSCKRGYKLVGVESTFCAASGKGVHWSDPFPVCSEIFCPEPPKIDNGIIDDERDTYAYGQSITYVCNRGFTLFGKSSIHCTVKDDQGEWSDLAPECRGKSEGSKVPPTVQKLTTIDYLSTDGPLTSQEPTTMNVLDTEVPSLSQNPTTDDVSGTKVPSLSQKPTTVHVPGTKIPPVSQKHTVVNVRVTEFPPSQKPSMVSAPGRRIPPTLQKPTKVSIPATEAPPTAQKATKVSIPATEAPPTAQKPTKVNIPATGAPPTPQKPTKVSIPATGAPPTPQKPTKVSIPATEAPPTAQKPTKVSIPATEGPPTAQKPTKVSIPATEAPPTPQKPTKVNIPATGAPPTPQKPTKVSIPATEGPPTPPKFITTKTPTTKASATVLISPMSNDLSTKTPLTTQNPTTTNTSLQTTQATHRFTTAKALFTHSLAAMQKSIPSRVSVAKGRLTSAHTAAVTEPVPVSTTTMTFQSTRASTKQNKITTSDAEILLYGKFDSQGVQRNCHPCGRHSPYFWKKILSFNCLRKTIKIRCLWARKGKGRRVNALYWHVLWTPLDTRYISSYSQQCSCSKAILGQLQIVWPSSQVVLYARCLSRAF